MKNIIFEDDDILLVNKPFGMLSQPDKKNMEEDLYSIVSKYLKNDNIGLINRLDRGVGGLVLFSKNTLSSKALTLDMKNHNIEKTYLSVVSGSPKEEDYLIDWLFKNQRLNISKVVCKNSPGSKEARLKYYNLNSKQIKDKIYTLLKIELETGRHHQIRAQLANQNLFIYGDKKYSNNKEKSQGYIALFAYKLKFKHPRTQKDLCFKALPFDTNNIFLQFREDIKKA